MTKVKNAVILAAGYSSRFVPLCFDIPKGLLIVKGETLIERQIQQLKELDINDICIVTGAYAEQFAFLEKKHHVRLIFNSDYKTKNNFASLYVAKEFLSDTLVSSSDLFFTENIFQNEFENPYYASVYINGVTNQRCLTLDENDKIIATKYNGSDMWITFGGHAVLSADISDKLLHYMSLAYSQPECANKYWVDFQDEHLSEMPMYIKRLKQTDIVEFNTLKALQDFDTSFCAVKQSPTMQYIVNALGAKNERDLTNIIPIKTGNTAIGWCWRYKDEQYEYLNGIVKKIKGDSHV